ncbi:MAG: SPOR domain-containing protein [Candidatus Glassbacteria bacterium]
MSPIEFSRKSLLRGTDGVKYLWETFPNAPFFELPFPVEKEMGYRLPLLTEAADPKFLHPYLKIYKALFATGSLEPGNRLLLLGLTESEERLKKVSINLSVVFAFENLKVNLIDLEFDSPTLHKLLGMRNLDGLLDHLFLGTPISEIIRETNIPGLSLITPGKQIQFNQDMMKEIAWMSVIKELVPDSGIVLGVSSGEGGLGVKHILPCFDGIVLFFSERYSIPHDIRKLLKKLKRENRIFGIIWSQDILIHSRAREKKEEFLSVESLTGKYEAVHQRLSTEESKLRAPSVDSETSKQIGGQMVDQEDETYQQGEALEEDRDESDDFPEPGKKMYFSGRKEKKGFELLGPILGIFVLFVIILAGLLWWGGYFDGRKDVIVLKEDSESPPVQAQQSTEAQMQAEPEVIASEPELSSGATEVTTAAQPSVPTLPLAEYFFTINVASYTDERWARRGLHELEGKGLDAYLVPVDIRGKGMWTRLMIGSYRDKGEAQNEVDKLLEAGILEDGRVIKTPFAFLVGEWTDRKSAVGAMKPLYEKGLFPYMVMQESEGVGRYRVFVGAFQGREQAATLEGILSGKQLHLELVEREG